MRIQRIQIVLFFFVALLFTACEYSDSTMEYDLGNDFIDDPARVFMIDTFTLKTYTSISDSFPTSRAKRLLTGNSINENGVNTYCESYFRIENEDYGSFLESAQYDSIGFIIKLDGYNLGDTTQTSEFEIYRLAEDIEIDSETEYIYNKTRFDVEEIPLGRFTVDFSGKTDSIHVRLDDELGRELYSLIVDDPDSIIESDSFLDYFKGLSIRPVAGKSHCVVGFEAIPDTTSSPRIRVYYHDNTMTDDLTIDFPLQVYDKTNSTKFNYYSTNYILNTYTDPQISALKPSTDWLPSNKTNNICSLQPGISLTTRLEIPFIDDLYYMGTSTVVKAELLIYPLAGSFYEEADLPKSISINLVNSKNEYFSPLYTVGSTSVESNAVLHYNDEFKDETYYSIDISSYIKDEYDSKTAPEYSLLMYIPFESTLPSITPLFFGDQNHKGGAMKLKVYMANFKNLTE